jgi:4-hydroxy-2-oxoheptanedioate aldolase
MTPAFATIDRKSPRPLFGLSIMYPSVGALERIGPDWDWIWIDAQHGDMDYRESVNLVRVTTLIGCPGVVRIPSHDPGWVGKLLDAGAAGIIVPMVENVQEAKAMIAAAKFPPLGNRSYGGRRVVDFQGRGYYKTANQDTVLIIQLESNEAVAQADEIASTAGVDGLFLGPDDLFIRDGKDVDMAKTPETIGKQHKTVAAACRKHGKLLVGHGVNDATLGMAKEYGYDMVIGGGDVTFLAGGSKTASQKMHSFFKPSPDSVPGAPPVKGTGKAPGSLY